LADFSEDRRCAPALASQENGENEIDFGQALRLVDEARLERLLRETDVLIASHLSACKWSPPRCLSARR
jgi:hypothetical protein